MKDITGNEINKGDYVNVYFTSGDKEHCHDCVFKAYIGVLGDIQFSFVDLLWESFGHNQYPMSTTLSLSYQTLNYSHLNSRGVKLIVPDSFNEGHFYGKMWKGNDESDYFEIIKDYKAKEAKS